MAHHTVETITLDIEGDISPEEAAEMLALVQGKYPPPPSSAIAKVTKKAPDKDTTHDFRLKDGLYCMQ